jgi:antitoxin (DNA-binding transcriptional repressor) of toxin-antitoxin stability system
MRSVVAESKNRLSKYLRFAKAGEEVGGSLAATRLT